MLRIVQRPSAWLVLLFLCSFLGCGAGGPAVVSGKVAYRGEPVREGAIRFTPMGDTEGPGCGAKISEGRYEVTQDAHLQAGKYRVSIVATRATGKKIRREERQEGESQMMNQVVQYLPQHYNRNSELSVELTEGENECDFDLK